METEGKWEILDVDNSRAQEVTQYTPNGIIRKSIEEFKKEHELHPMIWALANGWEPYATGETWRHIFRRKFIRNY